MRWVLVPLLLAIPPSLPACAKQPEPPPAPALAAASARVADRAPEPAPVRREPESAMPPPAQGAFDHHCGECHRSDRETAKPKALAIFDLTHEGWLAGMTASQVKGAVM